MKLCRSIPVATGLIAAMLCLAGCGSEGPEAGTKATPVRFVGAGGLVAPLLDIYNRGIEAAEFSATGEYIGSVVALDEVERGRADVTFAAGASAYEAFFEGSESLPSPHRNLTGLALLNTSALHVIVGSDVPFRGLADLGGMRIAIGTLGTNSERIARVVLPGFGIPDSSLEALGALDAPARLADGGIDAYFVTLPYPSQSVAQSLRVPGMRIVSLPASDTEQLRSQYPYFKPVVIPAGAYSANGEIRTVGLDRVMVGRKDLDERIVSRMLELFFDSILELSELQPTLSSVRLDRASGTPIPLHPGAARFYRERDLFQ